MSRPLRDDPLSRSPAAPANDPPSSTTGVVGVGGGRGSSSGERAAEKARDPVSPSRPVEVGGRAGPEPTRYGDWEKGGRCIDF